MTFEVTTASEGIHQICVRESSQRLGKRAMSSLHALRTDIFKMVGANQKVYITCFVMERQYNIKVKGATASDDALIINITKAGEITHVKRFSTEFNVTSAEEGIQKIVAMEIRNNLPENVMSYLYSLRTNICHQVGSNEKFCIHVFVMERRYKIIVQGGGDNNNRLTINIDEKGRVRTQIHRINVIEIQSNSPDGGIQKILNGHVFSTDRQEKLEKLRTDILKKLYGEEHVQITVYVDQMCFRVNVKEARWNVVVNITDSETEILVKSLDWVPTIWKFVYWLPEHVFPVLAAIFNTVSNLPEQTFNFIKWLFEAKNDPSVDDNKKEN